MSLQRLYWIPKGFDATQGVYVHYPTEELFAVLNLESHRQQCALVGEDLGTVTPEIRNLLDEHRIFRMYVGQFECAPESSPPFSEPKASVIASLNTHDTPTAAAFWLGKDIELRQTMGFLDKSGVEKEQHMRQVTRDSFLKHFSISGDFTKAEVIKEVLRRWMLELATSPARFFLINLEDLWLEKSPQNIPGTGHERPNWQRKSALSLEEICRDPEIVSFLEELDSVRKRIGELSTEPVFPEKD
jgi:4-alpha-glucanotransferase